MSAFEGAIGVSASWNVERKGGLTEAFRELLGMGVGVLEGVVASAPEDQRARFRPVASPTARDASPWPARSEMAGEKSTRLATWALPTGRPEPGPWRPRHQRSALAARLRASILVIPAVRVRISDGDRLLDEFRESVEAGDDLETNAARAKLVEARLSGRDVTLDRFCRTLFELQRREPGLRLALAPTDRPDSTPTAEELAWVLDELRSSSIGYWHDTGVCGVRESLSLDSASDWIDAGAHRMLGSYVSGHSGFRAGFPPGIGGLDPHETTAHLSPRIPKILKLMPTTDRGAVLEGLRSFGSA